MQGTAASVNEGYDREVFHEIGKELLADAKRRGVDNALLMLVWERLEADDILGPLMKKNSPNAGRQVLVGIRFLLACLAHSIPYNINTKSVGRCAKKFGVELDGRETLA
ncbi:MAG: hypothetical protein ACYC55_02905 [Candidatus Geothermincolia bacterium]